METWRSRSSEDAVHRRNRLLLHVREDVAVGVEGYGDRRVPRSSRTGKPAKSLRGVNVRGGPRLPRGFIWDPLKQDWAPTRSRIPAQKTPEVRWIKHTNLLLLTRFCPLRPRGSMLEPGSSSRTVRGQNRPTRIPSRVPVRASSGSGVRSDSRGTTLSTLVLKLERDHSGRHGRWARPVGALEIATLGTLGTLGGGQCCSWLETDCKRRMSEAA